MIPQIEENDMGFTSLWSNAKKMECGVLFLNPLFVDDLFFNKLSNVSCTSEQMIDESLKYFKQEHLSPCVYSVNYKELENLLERKGFVHHDTLHVLKRNNVETRKINTIKINHDTASLWSGIFCRAYDCLEWEDNVTTTVANSLHYADYFVDESKSSCVALYEKNNILGLYCLGTLPGRRHGGLGSLLVDFASSEVKSRSLECLILETYGRDNLLKFYSKLGFEQVYEKKVYTI
ncbi:MAG: GNAT family N-acetyltransferase [Thaumarchaeota archaeon]|nr:GNAT family N-acetyltransferase [Nitrososphaerota archaeon]